MVIAYKGFKKGLIATRGRGDYGYKEGKNEFKAAQCRVTGAHCAEDPLDMFVYYPDIEDSEYRLVMCGGDIHEDGTDSKIACTELVVGRELSICDIVLHTLNYWRKHPERRRKNFAKTGYFKLCSGKAPMLKGSVGEWLGFAIGDDKTISDIGMLFVDGKVIKADILYDIDGKEIKGSDNNARHRKNKCAAV